MNRGGGQPVMRGGPAGTFVHYRPTGASFRGIGCPRMGAAMDLHSKAYSLQGGLYARPCALPKTTTDVRRLTCPDCEALIRAVLDAPPRSTRA